MTRDEAAEGGTQGNDASQDFRLSLVLPAWNEEAGIALAIDESHAALSRVTREFEIIVVDDGSTDATAEIVDDIAKNVSGVRLIRHGRNIGYGAALRNGFQASRFDLVAFTDSDCQFDLNDLSYMLPLTRRVDIVCGYRNPRVDPSYRRFLSWGYNTLSALLLDTRLRDIDCALKIFHRKDLDTILSEDDGFFVNTEMMTKARLNDLRVAEIGVTHRPRAAGKSKVASALETPKVLATLLKFWWTKVQFPNKSEPHQPGWSSRCWLQILLLVCVAGLLVVPRLSAPLIDPDEGRCAEVARTMLTTGDWTIPRLHQKAYYDKPPLYYWMIAGSFKLFGVTEWAARGVSAFAALLTVLTTYLMGRRWIGDRAAFLSSLIFLVSVGFVHTSRFVLIDSVLSLFVTLSLFLAFEALRGGSYRWRSWTLSACFCAAATLAKGPVGIVLVIVPIASYLLFQGKLESVSRSAWALFLAIVFLISAPWYIAVAYADPGFLSYFFLDHNLARFFSGQGYHGQPFWYFIPVLFVAWLPASVMVGSFLAFLFGKSRNEMTQRTEVMGFLLLWASWCVFFFSLSRGKLPYYILPSLAPTALLLGIFVERLIYQRSLAPVFERAARNLPIMISFVACVGLVVVWSCGWALGWTSTTEWIVYSLIALGILVPVTQWMQRLEKKTAWILAFALSLGALYESGATVLPAWAKYHSRILRTPSVLELMRDPGVAVACTGHNMPSLAFYFERSDIRIFELSQTSDLSEFLLQNHRTLLVTKVSFDAQRKKILSGASLRFTELGEVAGARYALVKSQRVGSLDIGEPDP